MCVYVCVTKPFNLFAVVAVDKCEWFVTCPIKMPRNLIVLFHFPSHPSQSEHATTSFPATSSSDRKAFLRANLFLFLLLLLLPPLLLLLLLLRLLPLQQVPLGLLLRPGHIKMEETRMKRTKKMKTKIFSV